MSPNDTGLTTHEDCKVARKATNYTGYHLSPASITRAARRGHVAGRHAPLHNSLTRAQEKRNYKRSARPDEGGIAPKKYHKPPTITCTARTEIEQQYASWTRDPNTGENDQMDGEDVRATCPGANGEVSH